MVDRVQSFSHLNAENDLSHATLTTATIINILKILFRTAKDYMGGGGGGHLPRLPPSNYGPVK